jgi:hypothetical protein
MHGEPKENAGAKAGVLSENNEKKQAVVTGKKDEIEFRVNDMMLISSIGVFFSDNQPCVPLIVLSYWSQSIILHGKQPS